MAGQYIPVLSLQPPTYHSYVFLNIDNKSAPLLRQRAWVALHSSHRRFLLHMMSHCPFPWTVNRAKFYRLRGQTVSITSRRPWRQIMALGILWFSTPGDVLLRQKYRYFLAVCGVEPHNIPIDGFNWCDGYFFAPEKKINICRKHARGDSHHLVRHKR